MLSVLFRIILKDGKVGSQLDNELFSYSKINLKISEITFLANSSTRYKMTISLPLDRMTTIEKIQIMEALWEDLSKKNDEFASPDWHGELLSIRDKNLSEGKDAIHDWNKAKDRIRKTLQ
jgi:hypothetical protein